MELIIFNLMKLEIKVNQFCSNLFDCIQFMLLFNEKTAFQIAHEGGNQQIISLLSSHNGIDINLN